MKNFLKLNIVTLTFILSLDIARASSCAGDKQKAEGECSEANMTKYKTTLESVNSDIASKGVGFKADTSYRTLGEEKALLESQIARCNQARTTCSKTCQTEAQNNRKALNEGAAQTNDKDKKVCEEDLKKKEENAKGTSEGMAEAMKALAGLMSALGMQPPEQETPKPALCTQNPNDPSCKTDVANNDSNSQLTTGEFRRDDGATVAEGALTGQADPVAGPAAAPTMSGAIAGAGLAGLGGGGGGSGGGSRGRESSDKKSEFDGSPKINLAGGAMGGGGGGGGARGGGSSNPGKGGANPTAGRTSLDGDQQAGKIAAAAEERLRGPASNEPLGGISSVYYLDNFSKVEKRMITERNTLHEH